MLSPHVFSNLRKEHISQLHLVSEIIKPIETLLIYNESNYAKNYEDASWQHVGIHKADFCWK